MQAPISAVAPRTHEYVRPGLYFGRPQPGSKTGEASAAGAPWATEIKPRANVLVSPGGQDSSAHFLLFSRAIAFAAHIIRRTASRRLKRSGPENTLFQRYFLDPYRFVPPYRGKLWCRVAKHVMPRHLRRKMGVPLLHFQGLEYLRDSLSKNAGILLASNHVRWADPIVVGAMGLEVQRYFYYVVSYHIFKQNRVIGWWLNRIGGYSILREGADREAIRATVGILTKAERPILMFPEGTWFRQNDRVGPLQEGLGLIVRQAVKQSERPILIHPVGIKYWLLGDPRPELNRRVEKLERGLGWLPKHGANLPERLGQVGNALLAVKEIERFGRAQEGALDERIRRLTCVLIGDMEKRYLGKEYEGWNLERVRRLRLILVRKLTESRDDADASRVTREALEVLLFCENLSAHSHEYLAERPSLERIAETIQRIEETMADRMEEPVGELGATLAVGPAVDVRAFASKRAARDAGDPLTAAAADGMKSLLLQMLEQGPPPDWNCLPPVGNPLSSAVQWSNGAVVKPDKHAVT